MGKERGGRRSGVPRVEQDEERRSWEDISTLFPFLWFPIYCITSASMHGSLFQTPPLPLKNFSKCQLVSTLRRRSGCPSVSPLLPMRMRISLLLPPHPPRMQHWQQMTPSLLEDTGSFSMIFPQVASHRHRALWSPPRLVHLPCVLLTTSLAVQHC